ncbi:hypothetical protein K469DRAFT_46480 [Zopfia rhizophila CBS 207.26]|uniref:Uncharacterized protein n=1 Tax=Zopfia rhizophila CBS 207.26 TaxID=1314779 RepID=A0A6A6ECX3_9PEZI|nr:hypothetical protein K469DRAFT_46480 [Zopfia rhizophila CBS 207.26]
MTSQCLASLAAAARRWGCSPSSSLSSREHHNSPGQLLSHVTTATLCLKWRRITINNNQGRSAEASHCEQDPSLLAARPCPKIVYHTWNPALRKAGW